jgi:transaldolase
MMKVFADTANLEQIKKLVESGVIDGVTTNPSLFSKEPKGDFLSMCKKIASVCSTKDLPLSVEVFSEEPEDVERDARRLIEEIGQKNISIKIPIDMRYMPVINRLSREGISINATCGYTANQLTMAAKCGARYVSLFYRRAIDASEDVATHLRITRSFIETHELNCEIIAGSIRKPEDITNCWNMGAHIATASPAIIEESLRHPGTSASIEGFMKDFSSWMKT